MLRGSAQTRQRITGSAAEDNDRVAVNVVLRKADSIHHRLVRAISRCS
jgi:hypothetical protein